MRKFIALLLIAGAAYYLYTHHFLWRPRGAASATTLKKPFAWKVSSRDRVNGPFTVSIELIDGDRWRTEAKAAGSRKIVVAVYDGSRAVSDPAGNVAKLDPRPMANQILSLATKTSAVGEKMSPQTTEQCDGHTCWRTSVDFQGVLMRFWLDARTHFPIRLEGTINGKYSEAHFRELKPDFAARGAEFFNTDSIEPLFAAYLTP